MMSIYDWNGTTKERGRERERGREEIGRGREGRRVRRGERDGGREDGKRKEMEN